MKNFSRKNQLFSLCGLNCGLCPMRLDGYCPGCGGGEGNQSCSVAKCSFRHGNVEYCFLCGEYPCERYTGTEEYDSFLTHRTRKSDLKKAAEGGIEAYNAEQLEKAELLRRLLAHYNDGRKKTFFCVAVNLLAREEISSALAQLEGREDLSALSQKEKAALAAELLQKAAQRNGVELKLRKKPKK